MTRKSDKTTTKTTTSSKSAPAPATDESNKVVDSTPTLSDEFSELLSQLNQMRTHITALSGQVRSLRTRSERELRHAHKASKKRKNANRKPSGFEKPTTITDELAKFAGVESGTEISRTDATRKINEYIKKHDLQNPENKRQIQADATLKKLLKLKKGDELSYFNLQKYMKHLFPKTTTGAAASSS